jgi:hypothetical protein
MFVRRKKKEKVDKEKVVGVKERTKKAYKLEEREERGEGG